MSQEAAARIHEAIRDHGPITFAELMEHALYGPGGFYQAPPVGADGHFVTSPHVHPVFSRLVGLALEVLHAELGRPTPYPIVEVGAGDGTMARELLDGFARAGISIDYAAVEVSEGARTALARLPLRVCRRLAEVDALEPGVVLANELLDNLPFRRTRGAREGLTEVLVGIDGDRLVEILAPCPPELLELVGGVEPGDEAVVPVGALAFVDELARMLVTGYAVLIDYGDEGGAPGPVHGYRDHGVVEDVLADPGSTDITAGVDLGAVARRAEERGLVAFPSVTQSDVLEALGLGEWMHGELDRQAELLAAGRGAEAARAWDGRTRAGLLVDPAGLGRLRWLVLATPGLPEPSWLPRA